jgi:hypothetical protein
MWPVVGRGYTSRRMRGIGIEYLPRSSRETLLDFWLEGGRVTLRQAWPSQSSSRLLRSDSMRCLRMVSRRLRSWWSDKYS